MSELLREAILGTAQTGAGASAAADALVSQLTGIERERALLLSAASAALVRRAASVLPQRSLQLPLAPPETLRSSSVQLTAAVRTLLEQDDALLVETLTRMARAGVRLAPELLPLALEQASPTLRDLLRPVLGERGSWLAQQRPEWRWALASGEGAAVLPPDFASRWSEGNAAERRQLFAQARQLDPARGRELAEEAWKQERAEQRAAFAEAFAIGLSADDQVFLTALLADRSAHVQRVAARLLWRLPGSELAQRMLARARAHVRLVWPDGVWRVRLPAEPLEAEWLRDGIAEKPPDARALGPRQWWLQQLVAAVPCATWLEDATLAHRQPRTAEASGRAPTSAEPLAPGALPRQPPAAETPGRAQPQPPPAAATALQLAAAAARHEYGAALLDGLTRAALRYDERSWFAPLWDAWAKSDLVSASNLELRVLLSRKLSPQEVAARAAQLVSEDKLRVLLEHLPRPWPEALSLRVLSAISDLRPAFREVIPIAALAIPVALLPDALPLPESAQVAYPLRAYVRALADFQDVAALRRNIAAETVGDD